MADVDVLSEQAREIVLRNPPARVLENIVLGIFVVIGWAVGRVWYLSSASVVFLGLAVRHGYRKGNRTLARPEEEKKAEIPPEMTQFGPNVGAWSEPG